MLMRVRKTEVYWACVGDKEGTSNGSGTWCHETLRSVGLVLPVSQGEIGHSEFLRLVEIG